MQSRWMVLALVVVTRTAMAFQFQSAAAVGPLLVADLGLSYVELGTLIGLYLLPGAFLAMPGGFVGARFGDRAVVLSALGLMTSVVWRWRRERRGWPSRPGVSSAAPAECSSTCSSP